MKITDQVREKFGKEMAVFFEATFYFSCGMVLFGWLAASFAWLWPACLPFVIVAWMAYEARQ